MSVHDKVCACVVSFIFAQMFLFQKGNVLGFFLFLIFLDARYIEVKLLNRLVDKFARMVLT